MEEFVGIVENKMNIQNKETMEKFVVGSVVERRINEI
jgi:hypothetical protein